MLLQSSTKLCIYHDRMTHEMMGKEAREKIGIGDTLVRISIGVENVDDLIEDLDQALKSAHLV